MAVSLARKQQIAKTIASVLSSHFASSFPGISVMELAPIILALAYYESRLVSTASKNSGSNDKSFTQSPAYSQAINSGDPVQYANTQLAASSVFGLMQVRGSYIVKKGTTSGLGEVERIRPDLASLICVNPGQSVRDKLLGDSNMENALIAGITILQGKYQAVPSIMKRNSSGGYTYSRAGLSFPSRISAAVGSYLGLTGKDVNGTSALDYASSIVYGDSYRVANNYSPSAQYPTVLADSTTRNSVSGVSGPQTVSSSSDRVLPPGC